MRMSTANPHTEKADLIWCSLDELVLRIRKKDRSKNEVAHKPAGTQASSHKTDSRFCDYKGVTVLNEPAPPMRGSSSGADELFWSVGMLWFLVAFSSHPSRSSLNIFADRSPPNGRLRVLSSSCSASSDKSSRCGRWEKAGVSSTSKGK